MNALKLRLTEVVDQLSSQSPLTEAINYMLNHWNGLTLFLADGRVELDTNTVERSMRPIALGRKNSLFAGSESGAESWAILASLLATAKLNGLDPQDLSDRCAGAHRPGEPKATSCMTSSPGTGRPSTSGWSAPPHECAAP